MLNGTMQGQQYQASLAAELRTYEGCVDVHDLPGIFHYWSLRYLHPKLLPFGFGSPDEMFQKYLLEQCEREPDRPKRFVSLGSGNCDLEIAAARRLLGLGYSNFIFDCLELNPVMLARGQREAAQACIAEHF